MSIDLRPEIARGAYSNLAIISHSETEFILDFAAALPGMPKPEVVSRLLMNPEHAKRLLAALSENISKYESQFGTIKFSGEPRGTIDLSNLGNFGNGSKS